jgi:hypothetical protein
MEYDGKRAAIIVRLESSTGLSLKEIDTDSNAIDDELNRGDEKGRRITSISFGSNNDASGISNGVEEGEEEEGRISSSSLQSNNDSSGFF